MAQRTVQVRYFGMVQGVGFRATARRVALGFAVRGWVKNEADGSVSLIATGESAEIEAFLRAVRDSRLGGMIDREIVEPGPEHDSSGFEVRH